MVEEVMVKKETGKERMVESVRVDVAMEVVGVCVRVLMLNKIEMR